MISTPGFRRRPRPRRILPALVLILLLAGPGFSAPEGEEPGREPGQLPGHSEALSNSDIVRMTLARVPAEEIVRRIRRGPVRFDVDVEMQRELRLAGVDPGVVDAMVEAMRLPGPRRYRPPLEEKPTGYMEIVFEIDPEISPGRNSILTPAQVWKRGSLRHPESLALGFAVTCSDPVHVPDAWQHLTRLDESFRRHKLLFFQESGVAATEKEEEGLIYLDHPERWRFEVDTGIHRGALAVVGRPAWAEKFTLIVADEFSEIEVAEGMITRFHVKMRSLTPKDLRKMDEELVKVLPSEIYRNLTEGDLKAARFVPLLLVTKIEIPVPLEEEQPAPAGTTEGKPEDS